MISAPTTAPRPMEPPSSFAMTLTTDASLVPCRPSQLRATEMLTASSTTSTRSFTTAAPRVRSATRPRARSSLITAMLIEGDVPRDKVPSTSPALSTCASVVSPSGCSQRSRPTKAMNTRPPESSTLSRVVLPSVRLRRHRLATSSSRPAPMAIRPSAKVLNMVICSTTPVDRMLATDGPKRTPATM
jgi:hypothetical protein